jgi:glyoxylase-like metal-dependent hydrolase (beta-lactamase superfamily II)
LEVAAGVHRLTGGIVNFYLVADDDRLALVDAGTPADLPFLLRTIGTLGRRLDDLDAVLVTHAHSDHIGFAERARTSASARVWIHTADVDQAKGGKRPAHDGKISRYLGKAEMYRTAFSLMRRRGLRIVPIHELSSFADGDILDVPGRPRVVHAPGHTAGTAGLLIESRSVLFSGDALVTRNPLTGRVGPQIMPAGFNQDTPKALQSLGALLSVAASRGGQAGPAGRRLVTDGAWRPVTRPCGSSVAASAGRHRMRRGGAVSV